MTAGASLPTYDAFIWPTVKVLRDLGGSGTVQEILDAVAESGAFNEAQLAVLHKDGPRPRSDIGLPGPNYERLVELKRRYDPHNLFRLNQNIDPNG